MTDNRITGATLLEYGACLEQVRAFEARWPDGREGGPLGPGLVEQIACELLPAGEAYAYRAVVDDAWRTYQSAVASVWRSFVEDIRDITPGRVAQVTSAARIVRRIETSRALEEYLATRDRAFCEALIDAGRRE